MTRSLYERGAVLMVLFFLMASSVVARDWTALRPAVTSEKNLLDWFGPPTVVIATYPWAEWSAKWKKRPHTGSYRLRYEVGSSSSALLVGPGGKAEAVEVTIRAGRVQAASWRYGGPSARSAASRLRETPEFTFLERGRGATGARSVEGGWLKADIEEGDTIVEVMLQLK